MSRSGRDRALLLAPAGPIHAEILDRGLADAEELGIAPIWPEGWRDRLLARRGHLAGSDRARAAALVEAVEGRPRGIWMARGGYGSIRTLEQVARDAPDLFEGEPVPLWGFSDGTALLATWDRHGWPAWHAPPVSQLPRLDRTSRARMREAWHGGGVAPFEGLHALAPGRAEGPLAGGNLCVLASLVGTPWQADLAGRVVFLEDTGEPAYKVDRLVTQLRLAGALDGIAGIVLGDFTDVDDEQQARIAGFFEALAAELGVPLACGLPVGHGERNAPLPFGTGSAHRAILACGSDGAASLRFVR